MATTITEASKKVFLAYAEDAGNWSGQPLVGGNVGGGKAERGNLTQLKKAGLIETFVDDGHTWIIFTAAGKAFAVENGVNVEDWSSISEPVASEIELDHCYSGGAFDHATRTGGCHAGEPVAVAFCDCECAGCRS